MNEYTLSRYWWVFGLRGLLSVIIAIFAFLLPTFAFTVLVLFFAAYAFVDGVFALFSTFAAKGRPWWASILEGVAGIGVGLVTFFWPEITILALIYLFAAWAFITGIFEIVAAVRLRKEIKGEWLLAFAGVLSVGFGILAIFAPLAGAIAISWVIGIYAALFGFLLLSLAYRLRSNLKSFGNRGVKENAEDHGSLSESLS